MYLFIQHELNYVSLPSKIRPYKVRFVSHSYFFVHFRYFDITSYFKFMYEGCYIVLKKSFINRILLLKLTAKSVDMKIRLACQSFFQVQNFFFYFFKLKFYPELKKSKLFIWKQFFAWHAGVCGIARGGARGMTAPI